MLFKKVHCSFPNINWAFNPPFPVSNAEILLSRPRDLTWEWKYLVFASPTFNHFDREHWKMDASIILRTTQSSSNNRFRVTTSTPPRYRMERETEW
jgi:hypothetical protein